MVQKDLIHGIVFIMDNPVEDIFDSFEEIENSFEKLSSQACSKYDVPELLMQDLYFALHGIRKYGNNNQWKVSPLVVLSRTINECIGVVNTNIIGR